MLNYKLTLFFVLTLFIQNAFCLTKVEKNIIDNVTRNQNQQLNFLSETVNINSGTFNLPGVKKVGVIYQKKLQELGFKTKWIDMPTSMHRAGHLIATHAGNKNSRKILLLGHMDTVFNKDSKFQYFSRSGNIARGPGVADMKGGNAVIIYALQALKDSNLLKNMNISVVLIGDEESAGIPKSLARAALINIAKKNDYALGFEDAKNLSIIVTQRRGLAYWKLKIKAKQGHSSLILTPEFGIGSILGTAKVLTHMQSIAADYKNISFNPALISGGNKVSFNPKKLTINSYNKINIIPKKTIVVGEIRFLSPKKLQSFIESIRQFIATLTPPLRGEFIVPQIRIMPSMQESEKNLKLFNKIKKINQKLNFPTLTSADPRKRGGADVSYIADLLPTVDGMGAIGGGDHSMDEYMLINETYDATKRLALFLHSITNEAL